MALDTEAIENNIVAWINANVALVGSNAVAVGDFEAMQSAVKKDPAIFVIFEAESWGDREINGMQEGVATWSILIMTRSLRGQKEGRKGAKGAYKISDQLKDALENYDPIRNVKGTPEVSYPMSLASRQQMGDPDTSEYYMWHRHQHPIDTFV